jgi:hypothetical protein
VLVSTPSGYEVSQTSATASYAATQTISASTAKAGRTIYVRLAASATVGTYGTANSPLRVTNDGGASVAVDGEVTLPAPTLTGPGTLAVFNALHNVPSAA